MNDEIPFNLLISSQLQKALDYNHLKFVALHSLHIDCVLAEEKHDAATTMLYHEYGVLLCLM